MKSDLKGKRFLIVDDNADELHRISEYISSLGGKWVIAQDYDAAAACCDKQAIDCMITDIHLDENILDGRVPQGIRLLSYVKSNHPEILSIAMSGDPRLDTFYKSAQQGAGSFITKPIKNPDAIMIAYQEGISKRIQTKLDKPINLPNFLKQIYERYPEGIVMPQEARRILQGMAKNAETPLVLTGETGTGKEQAAKLVHIFRTSAEGNVPFVAVNCATIERDLATSLLFGHKKGSFSGAADTTNGYVGEANGGILFLDEIHHLDMKCQQKLLRVLNDGTYERLGDTKTLTSKFQLITASTKSLEDAVNDGSFMVDLCMRIAGGIELFLQPLRERQHDIPALVGIFLASKNGLSLTEDEFRRLCKRLQSFEWKGNIRQLFKLLQTWIITAQCQGTQPSVDYLPFVPGLSSRDPNPVMVHDEPADPLVREAMSLLMDAMSKDVRLEDSIDNLEKRILQKAIERHRTIGDACAALKISRSSIDAKRKKHGI